MHTSVTRGLSKIERKEASFSVSEDAFSSPTSGAASGPCSGTTSLGSGGRCRSKFIDGPEIHVPRHNDLDTGALVDIDGRRDVDGVAQHLLRDLLPSLRIDRHGGATALLCRYQTLNRPIDDRDHHRRAKAGPEMIVPRAGD